LPLQGRWNPERPHLVALRKTGQPKTLCKSYRVFLGTRSQVYSQRCLSCLESSPKPHQLAGLWAAGAGGDPARPQLLALFSRVCTSSRPKSTPRRLRFLLGGGPSSSLQLGEGVRCGLTWSVGVWREKKRSASRTPSRAGGDPANQKHPHQIQPFQPRQD
jgi:hypothetical protein